MTLTEIIRANVAFVERSNVTVTCDSSHSWVSIDGANGENVFLQGDEADTFNDAFEKLYNDAGDVSMDDCRAHLAYDYLDALA